MPTRRWANVWFIARVGRIIQDERVETVDILLKKISIRASLISPGGEVIFQKGFRFPEINYISSLTGW